MKTALLASSILFLSFAAAQAESLTRDFVDAKGEKVGTLTIEKMAHGTLFTIDANLPEGGHAMHLHAVGKCEGPDFKSSGGHFNPHGHEHGKDNAKGFHAGDLPNLYVEPTGHIKAELFSSQLTLDGKDSLLDKDGSAIIIHAKLDDYSTDPTGGAGDRIACAAITAK